MATTSNKTDAYYQELTDKVVAILETNPTGWTKSWHSAAGLPVNAVTGKQYNGSNVLWLFVEAADRGYSTNNWATYKQWQTIDGQVRKGEKGTPGVYWNFVEKEDPETGKIKKIPFMRTFTLFNLDQVDGEFGDRFQSRVLNADERAEQCEKFFSMIGARVMVGEPSYSPSEDVIRMPKFEAFVSAEAYYSTLAHEHGHWTGAKSRLDRDLTGRFGGDAYAFEELVAELTAVFVSAHLGIAPEPREDHAKYIAPWLRVAREDNRAVYKAATLAAKATGFLVDAASDLEVVEVV